MEHALKKAGVALPLQQRVWLVVKDKPGLTAARYAAILKAPTRNVSSSLADLRCRKMVEIHQESMRVTAGRGARVMPVNHYSVPARMKEYELLPQVIPTKHRTTPKVSKAASEPAQAPAPAPLAFRTDDQGHTPGQILVTPPVELAGPEPVPTREEMDKWPLSDARKVYDYLRQYFNA